MNSQADIDPGKDGEVNRMVKILNEDVARITEKMALVRERLIPVVRDVSAPANPSTEEKAMVPLAQELKGVHRGLESLECRIEDILRGLEI